MSSKPRLILLAAALLLLIVPAAFADPAVRVDGITVGVGYAHHSAPRYPYAYSYWDGPFWGDPYSPFWPAYGPRYWTTPQNASMGQVQLSTERKKAPIYIGGAYAGVAGDLKKIWLAPGIYEIELHPEGEAIVHQRIYVLTGKTVKVDFAKVQR